MDEKFFKSKFDWKAYVGKYGDLQRANINTEKKAWNHAKMHGQKKKENRDVFNGDQKLLQDFRNFCRKEKFNNFKKEEENYMKKNEKQIKEIELSKNNSDILLGCDNNSNNNILKKTNKFSKKIYLIIWISDNSAKGINIDCEIIYNIIKKLDYDISYLYIPVLYLKNFDSSNNLFLLDRDIYIFSEVCYVDIYDFLFKNGKEIICIPNIDSYSTYKPVIKDMETDYIKILKQYSENNKFNIWCKTKQNFKWLEKEKISNIHYIHYCYNILDNFNNNLNDSIKNILNKKTCYLLLDTGNSTTKRKYLEEILDIFIENDDIPFTLLVKTTPNIYNKFLKNTKYENKYKNIEIICEMLSVNDLIYIYKKCTYFIYCSKFDGYGLALSQAIKYNLFIFTLDGLPWCEILELYPRKCLIKCEQDFTKSIGTKKKGMAFSQIYYKADFNDLTYKLKNNKEKYDKIINTTNEKVDFVNYYNYNTLLSNVNNYFQKNYFKDMNIVFTYHNNINDYSTETFAINSFKKLNINCFFVKTSELIKNIGQYKDCIILFNLKTDTNFICKLKDINLNLYGYTWDLINYRDDFTIDRRKQMIFNINNMKASFIVEDPYEYNDIINKCYQIFQPVKIINYNVEKSESDTIKFVHFGRLNSRIDKIIKIANTFPEINIYLYGYGKSKVDNLHSYISNTKNVHLKDSNYVEKLDMYKITKNNNTFVLSFSELPNQSYYSNRIPMMLGYSSLVVQEKFKNIETYFSDDEMIIYEDMDELKKKINNLINNFNKQQNIRDKGFKKAMTKYNFDNYVQEILDIVFLNYDSL